MPNPGPILAIAAARRAQTHCLHGHEYTPENTIRSSAGHRSCRICQRVANAACYMRRKKRLDGLVDEVALERARGGDVAVYSDLTRREHLVLVEQLVADRMAGRRYYTPIKALNDAANTMHVRRTSCG
jgi:hypothetical protein